MCVQAYHCCHERDKKKIVVTLLCHVMWLSEILNNNFVKLGFVKLLEKCVRNIHRHTSNSSENVARIYSIL